MELLLHLFTLKETHTLYRASSNTHSRLTSMLPTGFKTAITASKWPQSHILECAAIGIGKYLIYCS